MEFLKELASLYLPTFRVSDILEIILLVFLVYKAIMGIRKTRVQVILKGVLILFLFYFVSYIFHFEAILMLFQSAITLCLFAIIVVFQPEMRKFLEQMGTKDITGGVLGFLNLFTKEKEIKKYYSDRTIGELTKACYAMGEVKTGALIVIEREIPLAEYVDSGIDLNADISSQLYINIFEKNTPLHDGAVIQIKDKIVSATCLLPLSGNKKINKNLGTRHRAAIGLSEATDCLVLVVSEETGSVSLAVNGKLNHNLSKEKMTELLYKYQVKEETDVTEVVKEKINVKEFTLSKLNPKYLVSKENFSIKIISLFVAVIGWILLINISNPMTTIVFEDVPIEIINTEVIENTGKTFEITSDKLVDVKITDNRTKVDKIKKEDIKVVADLKKLSYVNAVLLDGYVEGSATTTVEFVNDNTITLELDSIVSKEIPIEIQKFCSDDTNSYVPILTPEVNTVTISGGKTRIDTIDKIVYSYDVTNAVGVYEDLAEPIVYDRNGEELSNELFTFNVYKVKASGTSYPVREVPINVTMTSEYIDGFKVGELTFEPQTLKVAGDSNSLDKLKVVDIRLDTNIDISGMKNNEFVKSVDASDYLPTGVYFVGQEDDVLLTLKFEALKVKTFTFNRSEVELRGLNNNYKAIIEDEIFSITVSGEEEVLNSITKDNVKPYIDLETLSKGKYNMIVQFNGLDNVILTSNITVKLKIDSKE